MSNFTERRKYQRCSSTICKVLMSTDKRKWDEIEVIDISAGGLKFATKIAFDKNTQLFFDITVYNAFSEFNMNFEGAIVRKEADIDRFAYGVKFVNVNKYYQIQLDEIIKAKISLRHDRHDRYAEHEDGIYTFLFIPKSKKSKVKMYR